MTLNRPSTQVGDAALNGPGACAPWQRVLDAQYRTLTSPLCESQLAIIDPPLPTNGAQVPAATVKSDSRWALWSQPAPDA